MTRQELLAIAKPIMFSGELVKAILAGKKTQTRRLVKPQPVFNNPAEEGVYELMDDGGFQMKLNGYTNIYDYPVMPRFRKGDILYVPEAQSITRIFDRTTNKKYVCVTYKADGNTKTFEDISEREWERLKKYDYTDKRFISPYWTTKETATLFLRVTNVRVERLNDITADDIFAEGIGHNIERPAACTTLPPKPAGFDSWTEMKRAYIGWSEFAEKLFKEFQKVWDGTIKKTDLTLHGWNANPWVIVYSFEKIKEC